MGLEKQTLRMGNGKDHPQPGDPVELNYTGYLYDESNPDHHKGKEFDSSKRRGPLKATIGAGDVIRGMFCSLHLTHILLLPSWVYRCRID